MRPQSVQTKQEQIAELARNNRGRAISTLHHHIDYEWVLYAYECTRKDGAIGVDGQTATEYATNLEQNLLSLIDRIKSGRYYAPAVRRSWRKWLSRRSDKSRVSWEAFNRLLKQCPLPSPRIYRRYAAP